MFLVGARNGRQHAPTHLLSEQDHQRMMDLLNINININRCGEVRDGDPSSPNAANYDKPNANRYAKLPDPLLLNDVKTVTTAKMWREKRRPEIVDAFEREVYGRVPMNAPKLNWEFSGQRKRRMATFQSLRRSWRDTSTTPHISP
jgi:hypothetical protein